DALVADQEQRAGVTGDGHVAPVAEGLQAPAAGQRAGLGDAAEGGGPDDAPDDLRRARDRPRQARRPQEAAPRAAQRAPPAVGGPGTGRPGGGRRRRGGGGGGGGGPTGAAGGAPRARRCSRRSSS